MNGWMDILQTVFVAAQPATQDTAPLRVVWDHISTLDLVEALTFISFGVVCLFYGWRIFKILVTICFGLIGLAVADKANVFINGNPVWVAVFFLIVFAVLSIQLMRWAVSLLGALSGGILTAGVTMAIGLGDQRLLLAGCLVGVVAGGMISFIVFRIAVILFTSLGGAILTAVGMLAIIYRYMVDSERLEAFFFDYPWLLPATVLMPMVLGLVLQHRLSKDAPDWNG